MKFRVVAIICCALALCFALVGCGGGVDKSKFTGEWKMSSSSVDNFDSKSMDLAKSLGLEIKLTLNEDGTGTFVLLSDTQNVTWNASSDTEGKLIIAETSEAKITLDDSSLTLTDGNNQTMTFKRP